MSGSEDQQARDRRERRRLRGDPILVIGVVASVATSIGLFFLTDQRFLLTTAVGLLGLIVTLLLDLMVRFEKRAQRDDERALLYTTLELHPQLGRIVKRIVARAADIRETEREPVFLGALGQALDQCEVSLIELQRGQLRIPAGDLRVMFDQLPRCREHIRATTFPKTDVGWWTSEPGKHYWELNVEAIDRGVKIERIFIYHGDWTAEVESLARNQREKQVEVLKVNCDDLPADLQINIVIYDEALAHREDANASGVAIDDIFTKNQGEIQQLIRQFNRIKTLATPLA